MKKVLSCLAMASLFVAGTALASGYRIPEQSVDSTAKSGANIASADKADATYFNPANMTALPAGWLVEGTATYLHLTEINYEDNRSALYDSSSQTENFLLPTFFLVSPDFNNFRFGVSLTEPYGLAKRWDDRFAKTFAEKFALKVFELNPTVAYKINEMVSVAGGVRLLYNEATVMSNGVLDPASGTTGTRFVNGDTTEFGYNFAIDIKPAPAWNFAITYRSHIDLDFEGDAILGSNMGGGINANGEVTVPAPAVLAFSAAYSVDKWTFDLTVDRTFWSEYESLDFDYDARIYNPVLYMAFDRAIPKDWDDTTAIRLGAEYALDAKTTLLCGIAFDENPVPEKNLNFELPDSDAWLFSLGARYKIDEQLEVGVGVLYDYKKERDVVNSKINGTFTDASAYLVSFGASYKF